jgi:hypothetical protein
MGVEVPAQKDYHERQMYAIYLEVKQVAQLSHPWVGREWEGWELRDQLGGEKCERGGQQTVSSCVQEARLHLLV